MLIVFPLLRNKKEFHLDPNQRKALNKKKKRKYFKSTSMRNKILKKNHNPFNYTRSKSISLCARPEQKLAPHEYPVASQRMATTSYPWKLPVFFHQTSKFRHCVTFKDIFI